MAKLSVKLMMVVVFGIICSSISVPPVTAYTDEQCWFDITKCMLDQLSHIFDKPSFNLTEALCCPLIVQTTQTDRECFCLMDTSIHQNPELAANSIMLLSECSIVDSVAALDNFCLDVAPSADEGPIINPLVEGLMKSVMPTL